MSDAQRTVTGGTVQSEGIRFYLGTHEPIWLRDSEVRLFVSRVRFERFKRDLPRASFPWALDSGGFTEIDRNGGWTLSARDYTDFVLRCRNEVGELEWAAPQDWMCEPKMLRRTGLTVEEHQRLTVENFLELRDLLGQLVVPVLQGWTPNDYERCAEAYDRAGVALEREPLVGLGTVCRRQNTAPAAEIVRRLAPLRLHGFGVKTAGLAVYGSRLASADSLAWSLRARKDAKEKRGRDDAIPLFESPRVMLCGALHPSPHRAASCSNCRQWALLWRSSIVGEELACAA